MSFYSDRHADTKPRHPDTKPRHPDTKPRRADTKPRHADTKLRHADTKLRHADTKLRHAGLDPVSMRRQILVVFWVPGRARDDALKVAREDAGQESPGRRRPGKPGKTDLKHPG